MKTIKYFEVSKKRLAMIARKRGILIVYGMPCDEYVFKHANVKVIVRLNDLMYLFRVGIYYVYMFRLQRKSGSDNKGI